MKDVAAPQNIDSQTSVPQSSTRLPRARNPKWHLLIGGILLLLLLALPLLPPPLAISEFRLALFSRFLTYAIVALGLDLIWGYTGILSLGHGVYFGLGAYCTAMYLKLEASKGKLPDFMAWSGVDVLPWFWQPFKSPVFALSMAILVPAALAALLGYFSFRSRVKGVFFSILSQALAIVFVTFFIGQQGYTGGTNGMTNFSTCLGYDLNDATVQRALYWITALVLATVYLLCRWMVTGRLGKVLIAIRDGENRVRFSGYDPVAYKVFVYAFSAALAGLAGLLFVLQIGLITPTEMDVAHSIKMVLWVALGGRGTLIGAILGAVLVNGAENMLSERFPDTWSYFIGATFILLVLFQPQGLVGWFKTWPATWAKRRNLDAWKRLANRTSVADNSDAVKPTDNPVY